MKALLNGQRRGAPLQVLILFAVALVAATTITMTVSAINTANSAKDAEARAAAAFRSYQQAVYDRCISRVGYDQRTDAWKQALVAYYSDLHTNIVGNTDATSVFYRRLLGRVDKIAVAGELALNRPTDSGCELIRPGTP